MTKFEKILQRLAEHQVDCVVVGGYAAMLRGTALMTQDVDIALRLTPDNIQKLGKALADLNPYHRQTPKKSHSIWKPKADGKISIFRPIGASSTAWGKSWASAITTPFWQRAN